MKKTTLALRLINLSLTGLLLFSLVEAIVILVAKDAVVGLINRLSPDHQISNFNMIIKESYQLLLALGVILLLFKGAILSPAQKPGFLQSPWHIKTYYLLSIALLAVCFIFKSNVPIAGEDGVLENTTVAFSFLSCIFLTYLALSYFKSVGKVKLALLGLSGAIFLFAMEEISWGQRIIGWETPEPLMKVNGQQESNLHNIFNGLFMVGYIFVTGTIASFFFFGEQLFRFLRIDRLDLKFEELLPSGHFFYAGFIFIFLMLYTLILDKGGETLELIFALTLLTWSYDLVKKASLSTESQVDSIHQMRRQEQRSA